MNVLYEITPLDTLFFRGSTPMESGFMNTVSLFPPPVSVLKGAFWTELCKQKNITFEKDLINGKIPLEVNGIFIKKTLNNKKSKIYMSTPSTWYCDSDKKVLSGKDMQAQKLIFAQNKSSLFEKFCVKTSSQNTFFVKAQKEAFSLLGTWVCVDFYNSNKTEINQDDFLFINDIYSTENRTNVALDINKKSIDGKLFSSTHIRLKDEISIVVSFDKDLEIKEKGNFYLGGENRIASYKKLNEKDLFNFEKVAINNESSVSKHFVSLVPVEATKETLDVLVCSNKIQQIAGWDLQKGYHKPSVNYIPSGAVFNKKINNSCIELVKK